MRELTNKIWMLEKKKFLSNKMSSVSKFNKQKHKKRKQQKQNLQIFLRTSQQHRMEFNFPLLLLHVLILCLPMLLLLLHHT